MVFDRFRTVAAPPAEVWPWVVQLGKRRGGWYLPGSIERWLPGRWIASRRIEPQWQGLAVGDRVDDYGGKPEYFDVMAIEAPSTLVYRSERYGTTFTWALLLHPVPDGTLVHLRFRGLVRSTGWRRWLIVTAGDLLDRVTTAPMLRGLAERVERP